MWVLFIVQRLLNPGKPDRNEIFSSPAARLRSERRRRPQLSLLPVETRPVARTAGLSFEAGTGIKGLLNFAAYPLLCALIPFQARSKPRRFVLMIRRGFSLGLGHVDHR